MGARGKLRLLLSAFVFLWTAAEDLEIAPKTPEPARYDNKPKAPGPFWVSLADSLGFEESRRVRRMMDEANSRMEWDLIPIQECCDAPGTNEVVPTKSAKTSSADSGANPHAFQFVHIPKCGGTAIKTMLNSCSHGIVYNLYPFHKPATGHRRSFAVIREPARRFESFLNYRLGEGEPRKDWNWEGVPAWGTVLDVAELLDTVPNETMRAFNPFLTQISYLHATTNILCSPSDVLPFLQRGNITCRADVQRENSATKHRGVLRVDQQERIRGVFWEDDQLWRQFCGSRAVW